MSPTTMPPGSPTPISCQTSKMESATAVLERALAWFESLDITVERVVTDNGSADKSHPFRNALAVHGIKCTRPYTPCNNGEAERFIQTNLRE